MTPITCSGASPSLLRHLARPFVSSVPSLDFLYPAFSRRHLSSSFKTPRTATHGQASLQVPHWHFRRAFGTTTSRPKTFCVHNPALDDDGKAMEMDITPRAAKRLNKIMTRDNKPGLALRIQVESGGCHGFQYVMSLVEIPDKSSPEWAQKVNEDDTVFQYMEDGASEPAELQGSPKIIMDEPSLALLKESKVDFTSELIGSQFKVDNPRATSSCGCGTSFDIEV